LALAASVVCLWACEPGAEAPSDQPPGRGPTADRPDLVLITVDTLRYDALGFNGGRIAATPVLDRLAAAGRTFPNAHAHNVVTLPSHANILTGLLPYQHGVRDNTGFRLGKEVPTAATLLTAAGYTAAAFVGAFPLDSQFGLDRGFELYDDQYPKGTNPTEFVFPQRRGSEVVARALAWWRGRAGRPRFLWVHLYDPHSPYEAPEPFFSRLAESPYLAEVEATDSFLAPLLDPLLRGGEAPTLVVFTADHGEALGQHGELTHGLFAYEETLHVPLVLWGAGVAPGEDARAARHVDILPTLLAAAGVEPPGGLPGSSLLAPRPAGAESDIAYFEAMSANLNRGWAPLRGVLRGGRKAIELPLPELYDLPSDPDETHNRFEDERRAARELLALLPKESAWPPERAAASTEEEQQLRSLGYLVGKAQAKASYGPGDDPKRLVALDRKIQAVVDRYQRRQLDEAVRLARELVAERPDMSVGYSHLAQALLEQGERAKAIDVMEAAAKRGLASEALLRQLALTFAETGRAERAIAVARSLAERPDTEPASLNALGLVLSEAGRQDEAEAVLRRTLAADPDNPVSHQHLSLVALRRRDWAAARAEAERALALNQQLPLAWNNLGVALYSLGDRLGALDAWERAVALDPRQYDTLYNLGFKAAEAGRVEQARAVLRQFIATAPRSRYRQDIAAAQALLARLERS
jgi:arylsulfatase A-like enzyme/Flp pilus assembly protein TadD